MNLAEIRKKAQQQARAAQESLLDPAPVASAVSGTPAPFPGDAVTRREAAAAEAFAELSSALGAAAAVEIAAVTEAAAPPIEETLPDAEPVEADLAPLPAAPEPIPQPQPEPIRFPAYTPDPLFSPPPQVPEPEEFDPLSVIMKGRELALSDHGEPTEGGSEEEAVSLELLCFRVAQEDYAISILDIKEIIKPREVTEVPRVPSFVRGILSLRGIIIPVFDMRVRLGLPEGRSERERIVVVQREGGFCGVLVDEVVQVVRIPLQGIEPPPVVLDGIDRDFVEGIGRVGGRMLILLDMEKVLDVTLM